MSSLSKKLLKGCSKHLDKPKGKLGKKLLSHELALSELLPMISQLADSKEKQQQAAEMLIQLLAPKASSKHQQALALQLSALGLGQPQPDTTPVVKAPAQTKLKLVETSESFASKPFKNKPCSSCPALCGGLCKCALKRASNNRPQSSAIAS